MKVYCAATTTHMVLCVMIVGIHLMPLSFVNGWDLKEQMVKHTLFQTVHAYHKVLPYFVYRDDHGPIAS